ncbi:hypothetical protein ACQ4PT_062309 [Festuca glaucescens]
MEAEAGGPGSERRKSAALGVHVRVPSPAEAHDSDPAAKQDDGGADRISDLPDTILDALFTYFAAPASTFRFSATLLAFTLGQSQLSDDIARALHFPLLKHLTLQGVTLSDCSLHSFISGCPVLECLLIYDSFGFRSLKINSSTLRSISIKAGNRFGSGDIEIKELVIENAPCLQRLFGLHFGYGLHVSVLSAPKLEAFGCFFTWAFSSTKLVLGSSVMQEPHVNRLSMARCKIKILAVHLYDLSLDTIIQLLAYFPCLEKLYVASNYLRQSNFWRTKHQNLITSLDIRLKTIVLDSYRGQKSEVNFATFFVLNAKVLELMTLVVPDKRYNEKFLELQRRKLQLENKASRGAQFHFTPKSNSRLDNVMNMKDAHDLDSWDPFIC